MASWDRTTRLAMALYDRACPWGELDTAGLAQAMSDLEIPMASRRMMRRIIPAIHREIKKQQNRPKTEG